jgi:hypothetical protein
MSYQSKKGKRHRLAMFKAKFLVYLSIFIIGAVLYEIARHDFHDLPFNFWLSPYFGVIVFVACLLGVKPFKNYADEINELPEFKNADYKQVYLFGGVAVNVREDTITVFEDGDKKTYPISQLKSWSRAYYEGGIGPWEGNFIRRIERKNESGIFLTFKDINQPKWQIPVKGNEHDIEAEYQRWDEILRQFTRGELLPKGE